ncbi:hypothetical protein TNCV_4368391 [Trichonephila clavipes]|nr:hypothetical protein TNCV_4368391 [Trichonephila clavipes]
MTHYSPTLGLLETDLVILNHGQVMKATPELARPYSNFHTTPAVGRRNFDRFNVHHVESVEVGLQWCQARTHDTPATSPLP